EGMTVSPRRSEATVGALLRNTHAVVATPTAASTISVVRCFMFMMLLRLALGRRIRWPLWQRPPRPAQAECKRDEPDRHRHDAHIESGDQVFEIIDVAAQRKLHVTQLGADREQLGAEAFDGFRLLGRQHIVGTLGGLR